MLALLALVEPCLDRHRDRGATPTAQGFEWARRAATADPAAVDVACLGDSVLKFGFAPRAFERTARRRADNWATVGNPPAVALSLLRAHLRAGGRPRAVVVDFKPFLLDQGPYPELDAWARVATWADGAELALAARDPDFLARFALARLLPSCRDRRALRGWVRVALAGRAGSDAAAAEARERNWRANRGAQLLAPVPGAATVAAHANEAPNLRAGWACHPANAAMMDRFFELAARHAIPVYWALTPIHPRLQAARDAGGLDAAFARFVRARVNRAPGRVTVVDARRLGLGPERFVDATHLDAPGAVAFTAAFATWFAARDARSPGPRWVVLAPAPPALVAEAAAAVEDLDDPARPHRPRDGAKRVALGRPTGVK